MLRFPHLSPATKLCMLFLCSQSRKIKVKLQQQLVEICLVHAVHSVCHLMFYLLYLFLCEGTGVVTSVPSDSPDDIAALRDLKKKQVHLLSQ